MSHSGFCGLTSHLTKLTVSDHATVFLVPQPKLEGFETIPECQRDYFLEKWVLLVASFEPVVRDPGIQMMHMVKADISGEPLERPGKLEVGASLNGRGRI